MKASTSGSSAAYEYDGEGRRVKKGAVVFAYDAQGRLAAEYGGTLTGAGGRRYVTGDHLGSTRVVTDGGGAVVSGQRHDYLPFGESLLAGVNGRTAVAQYGTTENLSGLARLYTGKERDSETGLDYFGARYFSAAQGRYTSPDWSRTPQPVPYADISNPQTLNLYAYVRNNPLTLTDLDGHDLDCTGDHARGPGCQFLARWNADHGIDPAKNATAYDVVKNKKGQVIGVTYTYEDGSKMTLKGVWAFIDNNAGNSIAGNGTLGQNGGFVVFASAQAGWDAIDNNLAKHAQAGHDILTTMKSYAPACPDNPCTNSMLRGNDPEGYARALAAAVGAQTTTKLSDLTRDQLNDMVVAIGRHEGYFNTVTSAK